MTRQISALIATLLLIAGCGGTPSTATPGGGNPTPATTSLTPSPAATTTGAGGTGGGNLCLNTPEEVSAALQIGSVTAAGTATPGGGGGCTYVTADNVGYAIAVVIGAGAAATIQGGLAAPGAVEITGIGDQAVLMSPAGPLVVRKGDTIISQGPAGNLPILADAAAARKAMEDLARAAVGRLGQ